MPRFGAFSGQDILARALRGSAITAAAYALAQGLRLVSNLILARLLFPEAFGLMALVAVVLTGLQMLSDTGTAPSIARSTRGDDPDFPGYCLDDAGAARGAAVGCWPSRWPGRFARVLRRARR
jgi:hypothetical protein